MSFTYSGDPSEGDVDELRFLIGDTTETGHVLEDEEILWALTQHTNHYRAAAQCCRAAARKLNATQSGIQTKTVGDLTISYAQTASKDWTDLADSLDHQATLGAQPFARGYRKSEHVVSDTDLMTPAVRIGMTDNPDSAVQSSTSYAVYP